MKIGSNSRFIGKVGEYFPGLAILLSFFQILYYTFLIFVVIFAGVLFAYLIVYELYSDKIKNTSTKFIYFVCLSILLQFIEMYCFPEVLEVLKVFLSIPFVIFDAITSNN